MVEKASDARYDYEIPTEEETPRQNVVKASDAKYDYELPAGAAAGDEAPKSEYLGKPPGYEPKTTAAAYPAGFPIFGGADPNDARPIKRADQIRADMAAAHPDQFAALRAKPAPAQPELPPEAQPVMRADQIREDRRRRKLGTNPELERLAAGRYDAPRPEAALGGALTPARGAEALRGPVGAVAGAFKAAGEAYEAGMQQASAAVDADQTGIAAAPVAAANLFKKGADILGKQVERQNEAARTVARQFADGVAPGSTDLQGAAEWLADVAGMAADPRVTYGFAAGHGLAKATLGAAAPLVDKAVMAAFGAAGAKDVVEGLTDRYIAKNIEGDEDKAREATRKALFGASLVAPVLGVPALETFANRANESIHARDVARATNERASRAPEAARRAGLLADLGLPESASDERITGAIKRTLKETHPDIPGNAWDALGQQRFNRAIEARDQMPAAGEPSIEPVPVPGKSVPQRAIETGRALMDAIQLGDWEGARAALRILRDPMAEEAPILGQVSGREPLPQRPVPPGRRLGAANDREDAAGIPSEVGIGKEPVEAEPVEGPSGEAPRDGGVVQGPQAREEVPSGPVPQVGPGQEKVQGEAPLDMRAQEQALLAGARQAILFHKAGPGPDSAFPPFGIERVMTPAGEIWFRTDTGLTMDRVKEMAQSVEGLGKLLEMPAGRPKGENPKAVSVIDQDGNEVWSAEIDDKTRQATLKRATAMAEKIGGVVTETTRKQVVAGRQERVKEQEKIPLPPGPQHPRPFEQGETVLYIPLSGKEKEGVIGSVLDNGKFRVVDRQGMASIVGPEKMRRPSQPEAAPTPEPPMPEPVAPPPAKKGKKAKPAPAVDMNRQAVANHLKVTRGSNWEEDLVGLDQAAQAWEKENGKPRAEFWKEIAADTIGAAPEAKPEPKYKPVEAPKIETSDLGKVVTGPDDVAITAEGDEIPYTWAFVNVHKLIPSHDSAGNPNPGYARAGETIQNRNRASQDSITQMSSIKSNPDPRRLAYAPSATDGAPIIRPDGRALTNGRTAGLQAAFKEGNAARYRAGIAAEARRTGMSEEAIAGGMKDPDAVLVRLAKAEYVNRVDQTRLARDTNVAPGLRMSITEQGRSDATVMMAPASAAETGNVLALMPSDGDGDLRSPSYRTFAQAFVKAFVPKNEAAGLFSDEGDLTAEGALRVQAALVAAAYGNSPVVDRMLTGGGDETAALRAALVNAAPSFAVVNMRQQHGELEPLDVAKPVIEAAEFINDTRASGRTLQDVLRPKYGELISATDRLSPEGLEVVLLNLPLKFEKKQKDDTVKITTESSSAMAKRLTGIFKELAKVAGSLTKVETSGGLFGADEMAALVQEPPTLAEALKIARENYELAKEADQGTRASKGAGTGDEETRGAGEKQPGPGEGTPPDDQLSEGESQYGRANLYLKRGEAADRLAKEIDRRYEAGELDGIEDLERRLEVIEGDASEEDRWGFSSHGNANEVEGEDGLPSIVDELARGYARYLDATAKEGPPTGREDWWRSDSDSALQHLRSIIEGSDDPAWRGQRPAGTYTNEQILDTAKDAYERKKALREKYKNARPGELDRAKAWLRQRGVEISEEASAYGQPAVAQPTFFSALSRAVDAIPFKSIPAADLYARLTKTPGVKKEELEWVGLPQWLKERDRVTKDEVKAFIDENNVEVQPITLGVDPRERAAEIAHKNEMDAAENDWRGALANLAHGLRQRGVIDDTFPLESNAPELRPGGYLADKARAAGLGDLLDSYHKTLEHWKAVQEHAPLPSDRKPAKFDRYTLPGGENYREVLLTKIDPATAKLQAREAELSRRLDEIAALPAAEHEAQGEALTQKYDEVLWELRRVQNRLKGMSEKAADLLYQRDKVHRELERIDPAQVPWDRLVARGGETDPYKLRKNDPEYQRLTAEFERLDAELGEENKRTKKYQKEPFSSGHFDTPNVLVHYRAKDRTDAQGKKVYFLEEVQSDWHQLGRTQGYADPGDSGADAGVPDAPFKKTWPLLAFKHALRYAAENGYDSIAWTPGEVQAARYDLSKRINELVWNKTEKVLIAIDTNGNTVLAQNDVTAEKLPDYIGKEATARILQQPNDQSVLKVKGAEHHEIKRLTGANLSIGGEGMKGFYDKILPAEIGKYVKAWGGKVSLGQPERTGESLSNGRRVDEYAGLPLDPVYSGMGAAVENNKILRAVVGEFPVYVMDLLAANGIAPEDLVRDPSVLSDRLPLHAKRSVRLGLAGALSKIGADLRAGLDAAYETRLDSEILPAVKASDIDTDVATGILFPEPLHVGGGDSTASLNVGARGAGAGTEAGRLAVTSRGGEKSAAEIAAFEEWHKGIVAQRRGDVESDKWWQIHITPAMREAALAGQPLFEKGSKYDDPDQRKLFEEGGSDERGTGGVRKGSDLPGAAVRLTPPAEGGAAQRPGLRPLSERLAARKKAQDSARTLLRGLRAQAVRGVEGPAGALKIEASRLADKLESDRFISLLGYAVASPEALGVIGQVAANPQFEVARALFSDPRTMEVLEDIAYSAGLPEEVHTGGTLIQPETLALEARKRPGQKVRSFHNHPNGDPTPSDPDIAYTKKCAQLIGEDYEGHTIIDHDKYAVVHPDGSVTFHALTPEAISLRPDLFKEEDKARGIGRVVSNWNDLAALGNELHNDEKSVTIVFGAGFGNFKTTRVRAVASLPLAIFANPRVAAKILKAKMGELGAAHVVGYHSGNGLSLMQMSALYDAADEIAYDEGGLTDFLIGPDPTNSIAFRGAYSSRGVPPLAKNTARAGYQKDITNAVRLSENQPGYGEEQPADEKSARERAFDRWFEGSVVTNPDGSPKVMYHGTRSGRDFDAFWTKGSNVDLGAHFGTADQANDIIGARHLLKTGEDERMAFPPKAETLTRVYPVYLSIKRPLRLPDLGGWVRPMAYLTHIPETATGVEKQLRDLARASETAFENGDTAVLGEFPGMVKQLIIDTGHDGVVYVNENEAMDEEADSYIAFHPWQIKSAIGNRGTFDPESPSIVQEPGPGYGRPENPLVAVHNTTGAGILAAEKLGGIPVPSLAVLPPDEPFEGYGEITLVGNRDLIDPKRDSRNKLFNADAYTPNQPFPSRKLNRKGIDAFEKEINQLNEGSGWPTWWRGSVSDYREDNSDRYIQSLVNMPPVIEAYFRDTGRDLSELTPIPPRPAMGSAAEHFTAMRDAEYKRGGELRDMANLPGEHDAIESWVRHMLDRHDALGEEYLAHGRKKLPYTLENVVAAMTGKGLRAKENGMTFGIGAARASNAKAFKSVEQAKKNWDALVDSESMEKAKKHFEKAFHQFADETRDAYRYSSTWDALDDLARTLRDTPRYGARAAFERNGYDTGHFLDHYGDPDVPTVLDTAKSLAAELQRLPTEYFEAKPARGVKLSEFTGAVVPTSTTPEVIASLKRQGITDIRTYTRGRENGPGDYESRHEAVQSFTSAVFEPPAEYGKKSALDYASRFAPGAARALKPRGPEDEIRLAATDPAGGIFSEIFASRAPKASKTSQLPTPLDSHDPEVERRMREAEGLVSPSILDRVKKAATDLEHSFTRHFIELDTKESPTIALDADILRQLEGSPDVAKQVARDALLYVMDGLDKPAARLFTRILALRDLHRSIDEGLYEDKDELPFGYEDKAAVTYDLRRYEAMAKEDEAVAGALAKREKYASELTQKLVDMELLHEDVLEDDRYYHRQVMAIFNQKDAAYVGTGSQDVRLHKKGFQKARTGGGDFNLRYQEAEFEWMAQAHSQIAMREALDRLREANDIKPGLERSAKWQNTLAIYGGIETYQRVQALKAEKSRIYTEAGIALESEEKKRIAAINSELEEIDPLKPFSDRIGWSIHDLGKMAEHGELDYVPGNLQEAVDELRQSSEWEEFRGDDESELFFPLLNYLVSNGKAGSMQAGGIFKAIAEKKKFIKTELGKEFKTWRDLIPDTHPMAPKSRAVVWQPEKGSMFYTAMTLPEKALERFIEDLKEAPEEIIDREALEKLLGKAREGLVMGGPKPEWVIPEGLAKTLDNWKGSGRERGVEDIHAKLLQAWKQWVLLNPARALPYNLNNQSGDLDVVLAAFPGALRGWGRAARDLWGYTVKEDRSDQKLVAELQRAMKLQVISSGQSVQEIPDINEAGAFKGLTSDDPNVVQKTLQTYWSGTKKFSTWRENTLRLALFRYLENELRAGAKLYGASKQHEIDAIKDPAEKAAKISRELIGDYGNISVAGQFLRHRLMWFYSWIEINSPRYVRLLKNAAYEDRSGGGGGRGGDGRGGRGGGGGAAGRVAAVGAKKIAVNYAKLALFAPLLYGAVQAWNNIMFPEEEKLLSGGRGGRMYLIVGRAPDGSILTVRFQGALSDALGWFGLGNVVSDAQDVASGRRTLRNKLTDAATSPIDKIVGAWEPFSKSVFELAFGYKSYPSLFKEGTFDMAPGKIRDKVEYAGDIVWPVGALYRKVTGKPKRPAPDLGIPGVGGILSAILTRTDPGEAAYWYARKEAGRWLEAQGVSPSTGGPTGEMKDRADALYYFKKACEWGDGDAAGKWLAEYYELGGTPQKMNEAFVREHPLGGLPLGQRGAFVSSLSEEDRAVVQSAVEWYEKGRERMRETASVTTYVPTQRKMTAP